MLMLAKTSSINHPPSTHNHMYQLHRFYAQSQPQVWLPIQMFYIAYIHIYTSYTYSVQCVNVKNIEDSKVLRKKELKMCD